MLCRANKHLKTSHPELRLLFFDGLRTRSVQKKLWEALDTIPTSMNTQFVAVSKKGSIYNYNAAVGLTLALDNGSELDVGKEYDHFGAPTRGRNHDTI